MAGFRWEVRQVACPEVDRVSSLLLEWRDSPAGVVLEGVQCDCPRLKDLDNWECSGSCWEQIVAEGERYALTGHN